jgi:hypothetical protein
MSNFVEDAINALPTLLGLGSSIPNRKAFDFQTFDPDKVRFEEDLPSYLVFGPLSKEHFQSYPKGWRCRWQNDRESTFFEVEYDRERGQFILRDKWHGVEGGSTMCPSSFGLARAIAQVRYSSFPTLWDTTAATEIQRRYRIQWISHQEGLTNSVGVPDGPMHVLCIPLGIGDLCPFISSFVTGRASQTFKFPSFGYVRRSVGVVNYVSGLNPKWAQDSKQLMLTTLETTGFVPLSTPTLEKSADGSSAVTVRRLLYLGFIGLPFAGLLPTLTWLNRIGWVAERGRGDPAETPRQGIEFTPFIGPANLELETPYVSLWDEAGCRRATWIMPEDKRAAVGDWLKSRDMTIDQALGLAREAERISLELVRKLKSPIPSA